MGIQQEARISCVAKAGKGSDVHEGLISGPDNGNPPAIPVATYDDPSQVDPSNIVDRDDGLGASCSWNAELPSSELRTYHTRTDESQCEPEGESRGH